MRGLPNIQAVLFDMGGTLIDYPIPTWPVMVSQCAQGVYGYVVQPDRQQPGPATRVPDPEEARLRRHAPSPDTAALHRLMMGLRRIVRSLSGHTLPRMAEACARPLIAPGHLFDDTLPALQSLRQRGYRLGLISNTPWGTPDYLWMGQLERFSLADYFDVRLFSSVVGFRKPDPRIFRLALRQMNVPPDRALFVGDLPEADVVGAHRTGMTAALIVRPGAPPHAPTPTPDLRIARLTDLLDRLPPLEPAPEAAGDSPRPSS